MAPYLLPAIMKMSILIHIEARLGYEKCLVIFRRKIIFKTLLVIKGCAERKVKYVENGYGNLREN